MSGSEKSTLVSTYQIALRRARSSQYSRIPRVFLAPTTKEPYPDSPGERLSVTIGS